MPWCGPPMRACPLWSDSRADRRSCAPIKIDRGSNATVDFLLAKPRSSVDLTSEMFPHIEAGEHRLRSGRNALRTSTTWSWRGRVAETFSPNAAKWGSNRIVD